ncbi:HDOD domain-containing protein [Roseateles violae]|uniref:HDOD domain-containing protein n=1 Tax=Roseateles violae TaxID=3058042 RepID=A0ABT8DRP1_9BURK|nr:HDOD domain-containing protein [Pelomonas sp. PFR6]MDN3919594.1 HDOD domain-containing protein [Pelomonas sp. PFR6]
MWNFFSRRASRGAHANAAAPLIPAPAAAALAAMPLPAEPDLDARFSARLLDVELADPAEIARAERALLTRLEDLNRAGLASGLVSRLPVTLPRLLTLVRRDDVSNRELAAHLARDTALLGEVIRLANSPRYRGQGRIANLEAAVQLLGQSGLQQLVSRVLMGPVFNRQQGHFSRSASTHLWAHAERCALACAFLRLGQADHFDAYLAGMLANAGLIAALRVLDQDYLAPVLSSSPQFHAALIEVTARLSVHIAGLWDFPPSVVEALQLRARREAPPRPGSLAADLLRADRLAKLHLLGLPAPASLAADEQRCWQELQRVFSP